MLAVGLLYIVCIIFRNEPCIPNLSKTFIIKGCWILSNAFSASNEMIIFFFQVQLFLWTKIDTVHSWHCPFESVFSHIEISNTLLRNNASDIWYLCDEREWDKFRNFMTLLIFVEIKEHGWKPFLENLVQWHSHQSVYANVFRNVFRIFIRYP